MTPDIEISRCAACGFPMPRTERPEPCPACLLRLVLEGEGGSAEAESLDAEGASEPEYTVVAVLGSEEDRTVYLARRAGGRGLVELCVARRPSDLSEVAFQDRVDEICRLRHAGLARVFAGRMTDDGDVCLVTEFVSGPAIDRYCERFTVTPRQAVRLFDQVCEAIDYAHSRGVAHGRLGPRSVLVAGAGPAVVPKVTGWEVPAAPVTPRGDVQGLVEILRAMASALALRDSLGALVASLPPAGSGGAPESVARLRAIVASALSPAAAG